MAHGLLTQRIRDVDTSHKTSFTLLFECVQWGNHAQHEHPEEMTRSFLLYVLFITVLATNEIDNSEVDGDNSAGISYTHLLNI